MTYDEYKETWYKYIGRGFLPTLKLKSNGTIRKPCVRTIADKDGYRYDKCNP